MHRERTVCADIDTAALFSIFAICITACDIAAVHLDNAAAVRCVTLGAGIANIYSAPITQSDIMLLIGVAVEKLQGITSDENDALFRFHLNPVSVQAEVQGIVNSGC